VVQFQFISGKIYWGST